MQPKELITKAAVIVIGLWLVSLLILLTSPLFHNWDERAAFGDMFGGINALFSGLASAGVIIAIVLQWEELKLQRQDLKLQRIELEQARGELKGQKEQMEGQKRQLELQNETFSRQQFEAVFFQLLELFNQSVNSIGIHEDTSTSNPKHYIARDGLKRMYEKYRYNYFPHHRQTVKDETDIEAINASWIKFFTDYQGYLSQYFRLLYNIIKFVDRSDWPDKAFYTNIVRAQLSHYEVALLLYNCLGQFGREKFRPLAITYNLTKHLPNNILIAEHHREYLKRSDLLGIPDEQISVTERTSLSITTAITREP